MVALVKVSDWNSFRVNQNYSDSSRYLYPSQCESFRINPKSILYLVWWKTVKNQSDLILLIPRPQSEWIQTNPKPSFQSRSTRINPISDWSKPNFQSESIRIFPTLDSEIIGLKSIPSQSELFRFILISVSKPMWIIPNQSEKRFVSHLMKNGQKSIRPNPIISKTSIRMNLN